VTQKNTYLAYIEGWISIILNIFLFALKYWAGIITGSIAIIADAWHTLSDSLSSVVILVGTKFSSKPADKKHPFGHGRMELISSLIIGVFLIIIAFNFILESVEKLRSHEPVVYGRFAIIVTIISIVSKEFMAQYSFWAGKKTNARSLIAEAWHHRSDALSSVIILIGIFTSKYFWWIDGVLGIIVAVLIFFAAYKILRDTISNLIGERPDNKVIDQIKQICYEVTNKDLFIHHIHIHQYGRHSELTFHIKLPGDMNMTEVHEISIKIEKEIKEKLQMESTIHADILDS